MPALASTVRDNAEKTVPPSRRMKASLVAASGGGRGKLLLQQCSTLAQQERMRQKHAQTASEKNQHIKIMTDLTLFNSRTFCCFELPSMAKNIKIYACAAWYTSTPTKTSIMRSPVQAAVLLCSYRGASAFFSTAAPRASAALRRASAVSSPAQQRQSHVSSASCVRVAIAARQAKALRAAGSDDGEVKVVEDFGSNMEVDPKRVAVLFDFDGTIGDTETPAMEVAFWELAPYFPEAASECINSIPYRFYLIQSYDSSNYRFSRGICIFRDHQGRSTLCCSLRARSCVVLALPPWCSCCCRSLHRLVWFIPVLSGGPQHGNVVSTLTNVN